MKQKNLSLGQLSLTRRLSERQRYNLLVDFTQSIHFTPKVATLRKQLLNKPGTGEKEFDSVIKKIPHKDIFTPIRQWVYFVESDFGVQLFFVDFFFPKIRLCVEIDGCNHLESYQSQWDDWRTSFIRNSSLSLVRYDAKIVKNYPDKIIYDFLATAHLSSPDKHKLCIKNVTNSLKLPI